MKLNWLLAIRGRVPLVGVVLLGLLPPAAMVLLWWHLTAGEPEQRRIPPNILPGPAEVFNPQTVLPLVQEHALAYHAWVSLSRIGKSYLLAAALVLPLGILMGSFGSARAVFAPSASASGYIPIAALVPLTMSWFGLGEGQKIGFLSMAFAVSLLPAVISAIDRVPDVYLRTATTLGASRWQIIRRVLVPVALPEIWQGMRLAFGVGWTYLVLAEGGVILDRGLGELVYMGQRRGPRENIYLVIVTITLIAWLADLAWSRLGKLLFPYYQRGQA